ncbi:MAG: response regulator [Chloroflexi bacterium]|nr:response regulator [Chloroflexota bacterium]
MANTILVVEDVPAVRELLEITLKFKGYQVESAGDGEEALRKIAAQRPDLVITDILMPRLDGFSLAQRLRRDPETRRLPIVFVSATYVAPEDKEFALSLGAVRFLEKPIDTEEFLLTVAEVLQEGISPETPPLDDATFYRGYLERLETKLRYKSAQIARLERLIPSMPEEQRPAFASMLAEARRERQTIRQELEAIRQRLEDFPPGN